VFQKRANLVLHKRYERIHHEREALKNQRGDLVAQRLSAASGHHRQRVAPRQNILDYLLLALAKFLVSKNAF
ncbi:MAG: hypothetical protein J5700_01775, partial [Treponema sp.]|nr:hypothetical protein [Treponema sp.]